jgi:hypothetical protein
MTRDGFVMRNSWSLSNAASNRRRTLHPTFLEGTTGLERYPNLGKAINASAGAGQDRISPGHSVLAFA